MSLSAGTINVAPDGTSFDRCSPSQLEASGLKGYFESGLLWLTDLAA